MAAVSGDGELCGLRKPIPETPAGYSPPPHIRNVEPRVNNGQSKASRNQLTAASYHQSSPPTTYSSSRQLKGSHWNGYENRNMSLIALPPKLKCGLCNKTKKTESNYSEKQLAGLQEVIAKRGQGAAQTHEVNCMVCLGNVISHEMTCIDCHKTMSKKSFAKTHRKDPDNAKCYQCMDKRVAIKTTAQIREERPSIDEIYMVDDDDWSMYGSSMDDTASMTGSMSSMTLNSTAGNSTSSIPTKSSSMNTPGGQTGGVLVFEAEDWLDQNEYNKRARPIRSVAGSAYGSATNSISGSGGTGRNANVSSSGFRGSGYSTQTDKPLGLAPSRLAANSTTPAGYSIPAGKSASTPWSKASVSGWSISVDSGWAKPPLSVAGSDLSSVTTNTETGSRARFPRIPASTAQDHVEDSDSDSDASWGKGGVQSATGDDDDSDDSDTDPDFFG